MPRSKARPSASDIQQREDSLSGGQQAHPAGETQQSLGENREKLLEAGADEYLEKNLLMPGKGVKLLPKVLEKVISRIRRIAFLHIPASH